MVGVYLALATLSGGLAFYLRDLSPLVWAKPWWSLEGQLPHVASLGLGLAFALLMIGASQLLLRTTRFMEDLASHFRPICVQLSPAQILLLALCSGVGEELFFRGLLQPWLGLVLGSLLFALLHQVKGSARWVWMSFTLVAGVCLGALFQLTGSLLGPILGHVIINGANLLLLRRQGLERRPWSRRAESTMAPAITPEALGKSTRLNRPSRRLGVG